MIETVPVRRHKRKLQGIVLLALSFLVYVLLIQAYLHWTPASSLCG